MEQSVEFNEDLVEKTESIKCSKVEAKLAD
jgi:hypothetical protein